MSSKIKTLSKDKIKKTSAQVNPERTSEPISVLKKRKPEPTKAENLVTGLKSKKLTKDEGTKKRVRLPNSSTTEEARHETVVDRPKNAKRAARPAQKQRGPWKPHSPSPPPSLPSEPEPSHSESEEGDPEAPRKEGESSPEAEDVHLYGFSTDEDSSGDDLDVVDEGADVDVGSLPTISRDDATVKRKLEKAKRKPVRAVVSHSRQRLLVPVGSRNWRGLSWSDPPRLLRRSDARILFTVWRYLALATLA